MCISSPNHPEIILMKGDVPVMKLWEWGYHRGGKSKNPLHTGRFHGKTGFCVEFTV